MSDENYDIVFKGKIAEGHDLSAVKQNLVKIFKSDLQKIESLFSGKTVVIKKNVELLAAQKYQVGLKKAGALVELRAIAEIGEAGVTTSAPAKPEPVATPEPVAAQQAQEEAKEEPALATGEGLSVLPVGSDMGDKKEVPEFNIDISGLSAAPPNSGEFKNLPPEEPAPLPDISGISLE